MPDQPFVHLHVHTVYSLLDGLSRIDKLVERAKALEMPALAITDHGTMFGVMDFYRAAKKAGIKPILGVEGYLAPRRMSDRDSKLDRSPYHMLMLAQNQQGYKNLLKIASAAQLEGFYGKPRIDREYLEAHSDGLIVTSGCLAAEIPQLIMAGREDDARARVDWYRSVFGPERFFLELQQHDIPELKPVNEWLVETARRDNLRMVATNDVHYVLDSDHDPHDTLLCIQTGALKTETNRMRMTDNSYYLTDRSQMWGHFGHIDGGSPLLNTLDIVEMCDVNLDNKEYHLPNFPVPDGYSADSYLRYLCEKGLVWRYGEAAYSPEHYERLLFELGVIHRMGFDTYFLIVWDLCEFARAVDIWWNVRGSGAGSVAAYCLGITNIDPVENNLLFERFLNPGRVSMPDIDMDFPDDRRGDMIAYTVRKYGEDKVAAIITFGTLGAKQAVRDVGRALGVDLDRMIQAARLIPTEPKPKPVLTYVADNPELKALYDRDEAIRAVFDVAAHLQGVSRHVSTHAAGVIISDLPLVEYLPLHRQTKGGDEEGMALKLVTQFPMETCESIGLLKVDFLGLSTLTLMRRASDLIEKHHGVRYTMDSTPYRPTGDAHQDEMLRQTFELISRGDTIGVFQFESTGMQQMLRDMRPSQFEHIIAAVSLYRPGPMDFIPKYNARMHGEEKVEYHHPRLEPILSETYGICVAGNTLLINARTGERCRIDSIRAEVEAGSFTVQGADEGYAGTVGRVTHWFDNGIKPAYRLTLRNGFTIKATAEHQFLTEQGWQRLGDLQPGDYVGTPRRLLEPEQAHPFAREKLRVLAYLIADGSLGSSHQIDFVNKEQCLLDEYVRCLNAFEHVRPAFLTQIHDVTRVMTRNVLKKKENSLLAWLRELGLKHPAGVVPGGKRSHEKSIPDFVFTLNNEDVAFFLASLWDCDGYMDSELCHYKTISQALAEGVQTLLLRLGIGSIIYKSHYESVRGQRTAYQVTLYSTLKFAELVQPHLLTAKGQVVCTARDHLNTVNRKAFIQELDETLHLSRRALMSQYGISRQHFSPTALTRERISGCIVEPVAVKIPLPHTRALLNTVWEEITSIEPVGDEHVYDITVEGIHNYVANNLLVHNCCYQEQLMQIASDLFGYPLGEADLMRRAVSKKKKEDLMKHKALFIERGPKVDPTITPQIAEKIFDEIEFFANYGFNKSHAADYAVLAVQTAFMKAHFPHEYMAALLSVYYDDPVKLVTLLGECKRMEIPLLPPDVNGSESDFDIQSDPKTGKRGIRFGMSSVKNVGVGAVEHILLARRAGGAFASLDDFCKRVDLRSVGKKAVECLIKVGALDGFDAGSRVQLVSAHERLISYSTEQHRAAERGQMGLFGEAMIQTQDILTLLPAPDPGGANPEREQLNWERELLGIFVSSHPIDPILEQLERMQDSNLVSTNLLREAEPEQNGRFVRLVGLVAGLRKMATKSKDMMAVAKLEDRFGTIDAVFFPRKWKQLQESVIEGKVIVINGKLDLSRGDPQVIVEGVTHQIETAFADHEPVYDNPGYDSGTYAGSSVEPPPGMPDEPPPYEGGEDEYRGYDSAPEDYLPASAPAPVPAPVQAGGQAMQPAAATATAPAPTARHRAEAHEPDPEATRTCDDDKTQPADDWDDTPVLVAPKQVVVRFHTNGDEERDNRRLKRVIQTLVVNHGPDRFEVWIVREGKPTHRMQFEQTTRCGGRLFDELSGMVGVEVFER